jgi:hypothetical protein
MHKSTTALTDRLLEAAADLGEWPIPEEDSVDTVGLIRHVEKELAELRRRLVAEMDGTETGDHYQAYESRSAKRSYNTDGLLAAFGEGIADMYGLHKLIDAGAVRLQWQWTGLNRLADDYDVDLVIAKHEIADGDPDALVVREQLTAMATPFPRSLIKSPAPGKHGEYVKHSTVTERLLHELGGFSFEVVEVVRGYAPEIVTRGDNPRTYPARDGAVVGVLGRLSVTVDGVDRTITEVGSEDNPAMGHDGDNLKNATSDALKRCAMRLGVGLHLWSQEFYYLDAQLAKQAQPSGVTVTTTNQDATSEQSSKPKRKTAKEYENAAKQHVLELVDGDKAEAAVLWPLLLEKAGVEKAGTKKEYEAVVRAANQLAETSGAE